MRTEAEIRAELDKLIAYRFGSDEELAGAQGTLRWVLGECEYTVVDWEWDRLLLFRYTTPVKEDS